MAVLESIKPNKDVDRVYEAANILGVDVVKLIWKQKGFANARVKGFDVPTMRSFRAMDPLQDEGNQSVALEYGTTFFYPDENGFRWGYVLGTDENLEKMVHHLKQPWYKIQDKRVREETIKRAEELGLLTSPVAPPSINVKKTAREAEAEKLNKDLEAENIELKKQLAENEKARKDAEQAAALEKLEAAKEPKSPDGDVELDNDGNPVDSGDASGGKKPGSSKDNSGSKDKKNK